MTSFFDKIISSTLLKLIPKWITPNHLTGFRFTTIPFVLFFLIIEDYNIGIVVFIISALTDAMDGALARTTNQITEWGKTYDPIADKLLIGSTVVIVVSKFISPLIAFSIILIELLVVVGAFYRKRFESIPIQALAVGKVKMVFQCIGVGAVLLFALTSLPFWFLVALWSLYIAIFFAVLSLVVYNSI